MCYIYIEDSDVQQVLMQERAAADAAPALSTFYSLFYQKEKQHIEAFVETALRLAQKVNVKTIGEDEDAIITTVVLIGLGEKTPLLCGALEAVAMVPGPYVWQPKAMLQRKAAGYESTDAGPATISLSLPTVLRRIFYHIGRKTLYVQVGETVLMMLNQEDEDGFAVPEYERGRTTHASLVQVAEGPYLIGEAEKKGASLIHVKPQAAAALIRTIAEELGVAEGRLRLIPKAALVKLAERYMQDGEYEDIRLKLSWRARDIVLRKQLLSPDADSI